jgi:quinone-modifying oxidoreductase subunit QmoB
MGKIGDTLNQMGLEPERVSSYEVAIIDNARVAKFINDYVAQLVEMGPSPMKGFG